MGEIGEIEFKDGKERDIKGQNVALIMLNDSDSDHSE
jgi:hypothetical protein